MPIAFALGGGIGLGLWMLARGLWPPDRSLAATVEALRRPPAAFVPARPPLPGPSDGESGVARLGRPLADALRGRGLDRLVGERLRRDLAVLDRGVDRLLAEKLAMGVLGLVLPGVTVALAVLGGGDLPLIVPIWLSGVLGVAWFFLPDAIVRSQAARRRDEFREAIAAFLELVIAGLSAGQGVERALHRAARASEDAETAVLRGALESSRLTRETPWSALSRLGAELGLPELEEIAATVGAAGTEGAAVRASLAARAASLRVHRLASKRAAARSASAQMNLPVILLIAGFLVIVGFAAFQQLLGF